MGDKLIMDNGIPVLWEDNIWKIQH
jgi:hypothetical protein